MQQRYWFGSTPHRCDVCDAPIEEVFYDAKTSRGWGKLGPCCFRAYGSGLGVGRGQEYTRQPDGRWMKTAG